MARFGWVRRGDVLRNMAWYTHKVVSGNTLASIANSVKPAQSVDYIKKWNGLTSDKISVGQTIKVYPYYVVQWGDTLSDIAKSFGTTYQKLHTVNPWIKNVNLIYPKEKIRLLEGMEPEETPPAPPPPPPAPPPPPPKEDPPKAPGEGNDRSGKAPGYEDDDFPAHRNTAGDYFMRIGDCQFVVPPEFIQVQRVNTINSAGFMRQTQSFKYKNGQSETRIELQLWFTNLEEINGFKMTSPYDGQYFYMDGLRPLIAQFKRMPFLPIVNEYLNDVLDIHAVAFSNLSFTTVEGFPDMIQANLTLYKMDVDMYIGKPTWTYDQHFMYPLFRWYYNQMLVMEKPTYSTTYLKPVEWANFTDKVEFSIINEGFLREKKATNKLKDIDADKIAFDVIELPEDLICTSIFGSFGTILSPLAMDMRENPTFQYMGGGDTNFYVTFETTNRDGVAILEKLYTNLERYSRQYRDRFVSGYVRVRNSIINMAGVNNVMIQDMTVATVQGTPDLFRIQLSLISYKDTQYLDQRLMGTEDGKGGFNIVTSEDASAVMKGNMGRADVYLGKKNEPWFITEEGIAEGMLDQLELYPDLELPTYGIVNDVIKKINDFRAKKGYAKLPIDSYKTPRHLYREYHRESYETVYLPDSTFVDPDFYFTYPEWKDIKWIDAEMIDDAALDIKLGIGEAQSKIQQGSANYGSGATTDAGLSRQEQIYYWAMEGVKEYGLPGDAYYFLLAICKHETAFGTAGQGRPPKDMILGYGSYDTNPDYSYGGIQKQMHYGAKRISDALKSRGYVPKSQADVTYFWKGGDKGAYQWASDTAWPSKVWPIFQNILANKGSYAPPNGTPTAGSSGSAGSVLVADSAIFNNAEADIIMPVPKDKAEETKLAIDNGKIADDTIMKGMLHDMAKYSHRGKMTRAFPTFLLCFVDEGMWVDYRRLWNNYYTYHAVEEISLVKERNNPVDTAHIRLQNIYGALNASTRGDMKASSKAAKLPGWGQIWDDRGRGLSKWFEVWFPVVNSDMVKRRMEHIEKSGFYLRAGARVHIRMGYGSVASMMPITFNGRITELDVGDVAEIICQSDGLELVEPHYEWAADSRVTWYSLKQEPKDIIDGLFVEREGWDVLANYNNRIWGAKGTSSKYGIEHFGYVIGDDQSGFWDGWFTDTIRSWFGREVVNGYDARKNIYNSNGHGLATDKIFDGEKNIHFWRTNKSPWDVMQILTSIVPDFELKVHEHNFHSTTFYGQPQWYMKYGYFIVGNDSGKRDNYRELVKPSQQYHHFDSMFDIITNKVKASDKQLCTMAVPVYSFDESPKSTRTIWADPNIKPELQKTEIVDTSLLQDYPMGDFLAEAFRWAGHTLTSGLAGAIETIADLLDYEVSLDDYVVNKDTKTEQLAIEAAKTHIQWKFREMYQGDLIVIGDSAVRPGDIFNMVDTYTQMVGQAEVGRVVHVMGMGHGFTTNIKPDLLAVRKNGKRAELLNMWWHVGTYLALRSMKMLSRKYIMKRPSKLTTGLTKAVGFIRSFKKIRNTATAGAVGVSALAGPIGWIGIIGELALWLATELIVNAIEAAITRERAEVVIMPLWLKNRPYVAGIDGHKELIPGYWDENIHGEITSDNNPGTGSNPGSGTGNGSEFVPEGYNLCVPTKNHRMTAPFNEKRTRSNGTVYYHKGVDYGAVKPGVAGDSIMAVGKGKVTKVAFDADGYGHYIILEHDFSDHPIKWVDRLGGIDFLDDNLNKFYTLYGHLQSKPNFKTGDPVKLGQVIGKMGNTGSSTAAHLHIEFRTSTQNFITKNIKSFSDCTPYNIEDLFSKGNAYKWK